MPTSLFVYEISSLSSADIGELFSRLSEADSLGESYFNVEWLGDNTFIGEFVIAEMVEESYFDVTSRSLQKHSVQKVKIVRFRLSINLLEVISNKTYTNKLLFTLYSFLNKGVSIVKKEVDFPEIIRNLRSKRVKVTKVCFQDFVFTDGVVGTFTTDFSTYGSPYDILEANVKNITKLTLYLPGDETVKISLSNNGNITLLSSQDALDEGFLTAIEEIVY